MTKKIRDNCFSGFLLLQVQIRDVLIYSGAVQRESASSSTVFMHGHSEETITIDYLTSNEENDNDLDLSHKLSLFLTISAFLSVILAFLERINTGSHLGIQENSLLNFPRKKMNFPCQEHRKEAARNCPPE